MSSIFGHSFRISVFGESHGPAIGVVLDGLPSGILLDTQMIAEEMARRRPDNSAASTKRRETDEIEILSGIYQGRTTGTPLCAIIRNKDQHSADYGITEIIPRPGHADYSGYLRYEGFNDFRGGGHFSGRLTAPLVFAGSVAKQILEKGSIYIGAHIDSINHMKDLNFDKTNISHDLLKVLRGMDIPVIDNSCRDAYLEIFEDTRNRGDSVGGTIEAAIIGLPAGLGSPMFKSIESRLSSMLFSIPAVKGVEFGEGFGITNMYGSQANDSFYVEDGRILTRTNHNGGINGGITNGMPIIFRVAIKPTSSIFMEQDSVNLKTNEQVKLKVKGRHDVCIVPRAVPVVEAAAAIVILDTMIEEQGLNCFNKN